MERILIVDDEAIARRMLAITLSRAGFDVQQACNGEQAWELLGESLPDAMVTDIDMPKMTGRELCQKITDGLPERTFPIFVVTSKTALDHRNWSSAMTNVTFLEKPYSMRRLVEQLRDKLAIVRTRESA